MAIFVFVGSTAAWAQNPEPAAPAAPAPAASQTTMQPGQILAAKVTGKVTMTLNGVTTDLRDNDPVSQSATVATANESSVILVFSNGATTQLGADTTLVIDQFLQDPFKNTLSLANLTEEPTTSHTKLHLTKGELVGKVAHLHHDQGSYFTIDTPVGAAGIRGTTFRIVFRPTGTGQAFAVFSLSTVEGSVGFQSGQGGAGPQGQPGPGQGQPGAPGPQGGPPVPGGGGVAVSTGQEVVVTVSVDVNPQTGAVTLTAPTVITTTTPINPVTQAQIVQTAQALATTAAQTTFTPPPQGTTSGGQSSSTSSGDSSSGSSSSSSSSSSTGSTSSTGSASSTGSTSGSGSSTPTGSTGTPSTPSPPQIQSNPVPNPTVPPPQLTPGAGT